MKSLFSTAALLCAVSFNVLQASDSNPYGMGQENTGQPRCIRVITEIPVEMAGFMMPRHSCEQASLPGVSEPKKSDAKALVESLLDSSAKKSTKDEPLVESVLQLLIALTKNLKVVPSVDDTTSTFNNTEYLPDPDFDGTETSGTFGVIGGVTGEVAAAREDAAAKAKAYSAAEDAAAAAEDAAKKAKTEEAAQKAREAAAKAAKLRGAAETAVGVVDAKAADAVKAGKPAFTYEEPTRSGADKTAATMMDKKYASRMDETARKKALDAAAKDVFDAPEAQSKLTSNITLADWLITKLRGTGAKPVVPRVDGAPLDIKTYLESKPQGIPASVRDISLAALPAPVI